MFSKKMACLALAMLCALALAGNAFAAQVDCDSSYCFTGADFSQSEDLTGICITQLPDSALGTILLGTRVVRSGDILSADQLQQLTFQPLPTQEDQTVTVSYLPIYANKVDSSATMTISIKGKTDQAPVAQDTTLETYKNLPNSGQLPASDPEGGQLTFTVTRPPKRGEVTVNGDGSFTYTPKKNKVGTDSFTYTATDPAGNVSRIATVTVQILKPKDKQVYADTVTSSCRFAAEWLKNTGIFVAETISGQPCFQPEKTVTRGEFVAMLAQTLDLMVQEDAITTGFTDAVPTWLQPYLAAALRSGILENWPDGAVFGADAPISGQEAALLLQNALALPTDNAEADAVAVMAENGIELLDAPMTRAQVAVALYQASKLAQNAPGLPDFGV